MMQAEPIVSSSPRRVKVLHATRYQYDQPVQRSAHRLHLRPVHDHKQHVLEFRLTIQPNSTALEYEDVFGNWTARFEIGEPYRELSIVAESVVDLLDIDPFGFTAIPIRPEFPVSWMPWEQTVLQPYLTPVELPETQLTELYEYAMGFVEKNNRDLMETLFNINLTLFREYQYVPGSTMLETTPYQVFSSRKGVCQDFANLFICIARLLGIPARYVCGYVYTGNHDRPPGGAADGSSVAPRAQSDASHAWVELYIPRIGWKGFDPTNGVLPQVDHVRVAVGRHFRDTAPTAGTIYSPANETMGIDVRLNELQRGS